MCEESADEVDAIMKALDDKDAALEEKEMCIHAMQRDLEEIRAKALRVDKLDGNFSRAVYQALGLVEHVQALEAMVECVVLDAQTVEGSATTADSAVYTLLHQTRFFPLGHLVPGSLHRHLKRLNELPCQRESMINHLKIKIKNLQWEISRSHKAKMSEACGAPFNMRSVLLLCSVCSSICFLQI